MRHSGSTALYNIVRLALERANVPVVLAGYAGEKGVREAFLATEDLCLLKIHEYSDDLAKLADIVITTRRDLRDTVASAARRKFPTLGAQGGPVAYARYNRLLYDAWASRSDYEFVYERFMQSPLLVVEEVVSALGVAGMVDLEELLREIESLPTNDYATTLLSPNHITDPERVLSYRDTLSETEIGEIEAQNSEWLSRFGYRLSHLDHP